MINRLVAAIRFLTIVPVPGALGTEPEDLAKSLPYFPVVGLIIGLCAACITLLGWRLLPPWPAAVVVALFLALVSGGLHIDGLADTADGFFSSRPPEKILAIMRDSRIGAMGVAAILFCLLCKIASLASLDARTAWRAALLMPLAGRCVIVCLMTVLPYVRRQGLGTIFDTKHIGMAFFTAFSLFMAALVVVGRANGIVAIVLVGLSCLAFGWVCRKMIGGVTGDTLGAGCELTEALIPLAFAVVLDP